MSEHLLYEDNIFYPVILNSKEKHARCSAKKFLKETEALNQKAECYFLNWGEDDNIYKNQEEFICVTRQLIDLINTRIKIEENELYTKFFSN